jgi:sn-1 stearoyl-lipid 9-desaturase
MPAGSRTKRQSLPSAMLQILVEPKFEYVDNYDRPKRPTLVQILLEICHALNFLSHPSHCLNAFNFLFQVLAIIVFIIFFPRYLSPIGAVFTSFAVFLMATLYNTFWYHRYCSHVAFEFRNPRYAVFLLWTNPMALIFREEAYAIPHNVHHQRTDKRGDPYGPHLGWLASFFAPEITQRLNTNITESEYVKLKSSLSHIGLHTNSYRTFKKTGAVENFLSYLLRATVSQLLWISIFSLMGGIEFVICWFAAIAILTCLIRDFNWRGHGGNFRKLKIAGWEFDATSKALNQKFYGFIASEWHDNHHKYPFSANNGYLPGQTDIAFHFIKLMYRVGIVSSYPDARTLFERECLGLSAAKQTPIITTK